MRATAAEAVASPITSDDFKEAFRFHPAGIAVVTADDGNGPVAMTLSSVASVGIDPPTLLFSMSPRSSSTPTVERAETVVVHLLTSAQVELARIGATSGIDRFGSGVESKRLPTGEPYFPDARAWLRGRIVHQVAISGSILVAVEVLDGRIRSMEEDGGEPLVYCNRNWYGLKETDSIAD